MQTDIRAADFAAYKQRFLDYTDTFKDVPDAAPLRLKVEHTFKVFDHACRIVGSLENEASPLKKKARDRELCRAAVLAALFHDCGSFPQFERYRTFLDAKSVNHAVLSFQTMRDSDFLKEESRRVRSLAQCAVLLHNRHTLPPMLDADARFVTDVVRDADKLDIFRIMVSYLTSALPERDAVLLHVKDEPESWSPNVAEDVLAGRIARYGDLRYVNDFRLLLGTWMHELRFAVTRRELAESGLMDMVLSQLPKAEALRPAVEKLKAMLEECRNAGGLA